MAQTDRERTRLRRARVTAEALVLPVHAASKEWRTWLVENEWVRPEDFDDPEMVLKGEEHFHCSVLGGSAISERKPSLTLRVIPARMTARLAGKLDEWK